MSAQSMGSNTNRVCSANALISVPKATLTVFVSTLADGKLAELDDALHVALSLG